jgi:hypothetical protein
MDSEDTERRDAGHLSPTALDGLAHTVIAAVVRQRVMRRKLWDEKLKASDATKALCGRLARTRVPDSRTACDFAQECVEREALPALCPLREEPLQEERSI